MKNVLKNITLFLFFCTIVFSQHQYEFDYDYAQFRNSDSTNIFEVYYEFNSENLVKNYLYNDSTIILNIIFSLSKNQNSDEILSDTVYNSFKLNELLTSDGHRDIIGVKKLVVPSGYYDMFIYFQNSNKILEQIVNTSILTKKYDTSNPTLSDIQLARSIKKDSSSVESLFSKNTLRIIPNPSTTYSSDLPLLQYYAELYNIPDEDSLTLSTYLVSGDSKVVFSNSKTISSNFESIAHIDQINLLKYPTGVYTLQLIFSSASKEYAFVSQKQFYFYNKFYTVNSIEGTSDQVLQKESPFSYFSAEECDEVFNQARYIATSKEIDRYESISSAEGKREFLARFWESKNTTGSENKISYEEYMNRVDKANSKFRGLRANGYSTERGRVFIKYGEPNKVEQFPNESNLRPYEIWYYDTLEGGVVFIFGDLNGFGDYDLIHSTKRGEIFDDTWQRRLYIY